MSLFKTALNTSTLMPFKLPILEQIEIVSKAGYDGIELWVKDIEQFVNQGGTIAEIKEKLDNEKLNLVNAIAFWKWADADEIERSKGLEHAKKELAWLAELGCPAAAAPPFGNVASVSLTEMANHFQILAELARSMSIEPYLEFWGRAPQLSRLSEAIYVALESGVEDVKVLIDPFHMYTGGSKFEGLSSIGGSQIGIVHVNDYPASPVREVIQDKDRIFPGEGIAPTSAIVNYLLEANYNGYISLELFIEDFGNKTALEVAIDGLEKMKKHYL